MSLDLRRFTYFYLLQYSAKSVKREMQNLLGGVLLGDFKRARNRHDNIAIALHDSRLGVLFVYELR